LSLVGEAVMLISASASRTMSVRPSGSQAPKEVRLGLIGRQRRSRERLGGSRSVLKELGKKRLTNRISFRHFLRSRQRVRFAPTFLPTNTDEDSSGIAIETVGAVEGIALRVERAAALFTKEIEFLAENSNPSVIICALRWITGTAFGGEKESGRKDLHHLLKARTMEFRIPIQLILPSTYDESKARKQKRAGTPRPLQDEATRHGTYSLHCITRRAEHLGV